MLSQPYFCIQYSPHIPILEILDPPLLSKRMYAVDLHVHVEVGLHDTISLMQMTCV